MIRPSTTHPYTVPYKRVRSYYPGENECDVLITDIPSMYEDPNQWGEQDLLLLEDGIIVFGKEPREAISEHQQACYRALLERYLQSSHALHIHKHPHQHSQILTHLWMTGQWDLEHDWLERLDSSYAKTLWQYTFVDYALKTGNRPIDPTLSGVLNTLYTQPLPQQAIRPSWIADLAQMMDELTLEPLNVVAYLMCMYRAVNPHVPIQAYLAYMHHNTNVDEETPSIAKMLYMTLYDPQNTKGQPVRSACAAPISTWYDTIATFGDAQACEVALALLGIAPDKDHPSSNAVLPILSHIQCADFLIDDAESMLLWNPTITLRAKPTNALEQWIYTHQLLERTLTFDDVFAQAMSMYYNTHPNSSLELCSDD